MLGLGPNSLYTSHMGTYVSRSPSPRIWGRLNPARMNPDGAGALFGASEDFVGFGIGTAVTGNAAYYSGDAGAYKSFEDSGSTILPLETVGGGVIRMLLEAADNDECALQLGQNAATTVAPFSITSGATKPLFYEVCFRPNASGSDFDSCGINLGLGSVNFAANGAIEDGTMLPTAAKHFIGFNSIDGTPRCLFQYGGETAETITLSSTVLVTDTWYQFGFYVDPLGPASQRIHLFWQGEECATFITDTDIADNSGAGRFPSGIQMAPVLLFKNGDATARSLDLDWFHCYQGR